MTEREELEAAMAELLRTKVYPNNFDIWQASRLAAIDECAKVCEDVASRRSIVEMSIGAAMCAGAIRALKADPTGESK
ncbi:hypothetical protein [Burkholderia pseudomallei]|uniref:hypothetical protein n=1 Tax=Burkholderia pseudomallei TaxID=28450 RepID=UPI0012F504F8|nr:hypothetical protein [Burkholderia pseudomallei]